MKQISDKLAGEIRTILAIPDVKQKLLSQGMKLYPMTPDELGHVVQDDKTKYGQIIRARNIKIDK